MQTEILHIVPEDVTVPSCKRVLNFRPFLEYIKAVEGRTNNHKKPFFNYVIEQFEKRPDLLQSVEIDQVKKDEPLLELVYNSLSKMIEDEEVNYWALSMPMKPVVFYSTNAFYNLISSIAVNNICTNTTEVGSVQIEGTPVEFVYAVILEKYYGIHSFFNRNIVHGVDDPETGVKRYYEVNLDTRFIDILPEGTLPEIKFDIIKSGNHDKTQKLRWIEEVLPLNMFRFEGFGITTIKDVSVKYAVENIRNLMLNQSFHSTENQFLDVINWLKIIAENSKLEFGILPALFLNDKLIFNEGLHANSILINAAKKVGVGENKYLDLIEKFFEKPKFIFFSEIGESEIAKHPYLEFLAAENISSYALIPVHFNRTLVGVLEVYSHEKMVFNEALITKLDPVIPLLAQLLKNGIQLFKDGIERVIKDKFTSVQPSVQWKFNEAAWHYLRDRKFNKHNTEIEEIYFENVYPLYGAVDIRNSTIERNRALNEDMRTQFTVLISMLERLKQESGFGLISEKLFLAKKWLKDISDPEKFNQHILVNEFIANNVTPFLLDFKKGNAWAVPVMAAYFDAIDDETGAAFKQRRQLESSMNTVITAVNVYLDHMQENIQQAYPAYFEKFRTDGLEYDVYIGQSIAPDRPFSEIYLKNLRLMQLASMASIAKITAGLISSLPVNVQTTQLIFIHSQAIDIKFRKDEKRFDVEGSYNIRYHVVKKRIDKALIKDSSERLTQPDKIALVYLNQQDANEYIGYIEYLQGQQILCDDLEDLELEELQGVNGLRALRVGVVKNEMINDIPLHPDAAQDGFEGNEHEVMPGIPVTEEMKQPL